MEILDQMLSYLASKGHSVTKTEYEQVISESIINELPLVFNGVAHFHTDEVQRRFFLGSNVFATDPEQFSEIWKNLVAARNATDTGNQTPSSSEPSATDASETNLKLSSTTVRSIFEAMRAGSGTEDLASWASGSSDEVLELLEELANSRKRERKTSISLESLQSSAGEPEQLAILESKLHDLRAAGPQNSKVHVARQGLDDAWEATQLFMREEPRQFKEQIDALANSPIISNLEHVGYAIVQVSQRPQGLALGSRLLRSLLVMAQADPTNPSSNADSHLLKEDVDRLRTNTTKTVMLGDKRLSVDWLKSPLGYITFAACRDSTEAKHLAEALQSAQEVFASAVAEIEASSRKARVEQEELELEIANLEDALADMNMEAQALRDELASARERQSEIWIRLDEVLAEGLCAIHPEFSVCLFDHLYATFADSLFENLPTRKLKKELLLGDLRWVISVAQSLLVAAYQVLSPGSACCADCAEAPCACSGKDALDRVMDYCSRWHGLSSSQLSSSLNDYGDWVWGLFDTPPQLRTKKLIDLLECSALQFDRVVFRLRLGSILEETWSLAESDDALAKHGLPEYWRALAMLAQENSGKELPLTHAAQLVEAACLHPNPHEYAQNFWHDAATQYQAWKHENALKGVDEIPVWVPGPLD